MNVTLTFDGADLLTTTLQAFLVDNADAITPSEGLKIRASLLQHGSVVLIGGGAAPLIELTRAD